jgi:uridine phosphorylase
MVSNQPDLDQLHGMLKTPKSHSRRILMSRLHFGFEQNPRLSLVGPFVGAPYAVIFLESLIAWNVSELVFFGWCGAISSHVKIGDVVVPDRAFIDDGTSRHYLDPSLSEVQPSATVQTALKTALSESHIPFHCGPVWTTDAVFRETRQAVLGYQKKKALAVEMEAAALFSAGMFRGVRVGCVLVVSDELSSLSWQPGFGAPFFKKRRTQVCDVIRHLWQ